MAFKNMSYGPRVFNKDRGIYGEDVKLEPVRNKEII